MPTPLEQYRAWEATGKAVHVIQIDRGDGSPAHRITLTDRPYYDKGVGGVKYHHTYPAPIHCVLSDIVTDERTNGASIDDLVLANSDGRLTELFTGEPIIGHRFTVLRGDASWSLLETAFPNRFVEVARGQVDDLQMRRNGGEVVLRVSPIRFRLDNLIGSPEAPVGYGVCFNVPALLVDAGTDRYRFNTVLTGTTDFAARDGGSLLTDGVDYDLVLESGEFRGQIELLAGSPEAQLTADLNWTGASSVATSTITSWPVEIVRHLALTSLVDDYPGLVASLDVSSAGSEIMTFCYNAAGDRVWLLDRVTGFVEYVDADPVSSATVSGDVFDEGRRYTGLAPNADDTYLYAVSNGTEGVSLNPPVLRILSFGSAGDITTLTLSAQHSFDGDVVIVDIAVSSDELTLWCLSNRNQVYVYTVPSARNFSSRTLERIINLEQFIGGIGNPYISTYAGQAVYPYTATSISRTGDGRSLLIGFAEGILVQIDLAQPDTDAGYVLARRELLLPRTLLAESARAVAYAPHPDGDRVLVLFDDSTLRQVDLAEAHRLPRRIVANPISGDLAYTYATRPCGIWYDRQVPVGEALTDTLSAMLSSFSVSANGEIRVFSYIDPAYGAKTADAMVEVQYADFIGERDYIQHRRTVQPVYKVTVEHSHNATLQDRAALLTTVGDDDVALYSKAFSTASADTTLAGYVDPDERYVVARIVSAAVAEFVAGQELVLWSRPRQEFDLRLALRCTPAYEDFGVGSLLRQADDWHYPLIEPEWFVELPGVLGVYASTADSTGNSVAGALTLLIRVAFSSLSPAAQQPILTKNDGVSGDQRSWGLFLTTGGQLLLTTSPDGLPSVNNQMTTTLASHGVVENQPVWLKVDFTPSNGSNRVATFSVYLEPQRVPPAPGDLDAMETVSGSPIAGLFNSTAEIRVGASYSSTAGIAGKVYRAQVMNGINGTVVADFDPSRWAGGRTVPSAIAGESYALTETSGGRAAIGGTQFLVTGRRVNWSRNEQTITVFR